MVQSTHHHNAFAGTRVLRVLDPNVNRLFLGSMSPSRRDAVGRTAPSVLHPRPGYNAIVGQEFQNSANGLNSKTTEDPP